MKIIRLDAGKELKSADLIKTAIEHGGAERGIPVPEMRRRIRILDALDRAAMAFSPEPLLSLEDADYDVLRAVYGAFPWRASHIDIVRTADAIDAAESDVPSGG